MSDRPMHVPAPPPSVSELVTDDGEPMETTRHRDQMWMLIYSLRHSYDERDDVYVSGNMFVYFSETQARNNDFRGPDVFVTLGTTRRERRAWVVWEEDGKTPDVIIELTSDSTRREDHGRKKRIYAATLKVGEYFICDPWSDDFVGFTLNPETNEYEAKTPDERGYLRCQQLGLWLGRQRATHYETTADWLRWIDDEGRVLLAPEEDADALRARAEDERRRAEDERRRAEDERRRAEDERRRAEDLAARVAAYEARFGKLDG